MKFKTMKKTLLILTILLISIDFYSQEIKSEYKFKSEKTKSRFLSGVKWNYIELDSLILYNDNTFYRKRFYHYHQINNLAQKGDWKIQDGILKLYVKKENEEYDSEKWNDIEKQNDFTISRRKLIPFASNEMFTDRKLKLIK
jgi:hypothetical protein